MPQWWASLRSQKESLEKLRLCIIEGKRRLETPSLVSSLAASEAPCLSSFFICKNCHSNSQDDNTRQRLSGKDACWVPVPECLPNITLVTLCPSSPSVFQAVLWSKYFTSLNNLNPSLESSDCSPCRTLAGLEGKPWHSPLLHGIKCESACKSALNTFYKIRYHQKQRS